MARPSNGWGYRIGHLCCLTLFGLLVALIALHQAAAGQQAPDQDQFDLSRVDWWKKTNFYHIYLRSFKDSNGDGNGDLRGVIQKLDYLKRIGVETILMAPFYPSPMKDCGYDISDYKGVQPMFGSLADFDELIRELTRRDMRMVVDFVPNHSSNKHPWFECSERAFLEPERCGKYKDYYVWTNSTRFQNKYPSNWVSVFGGGPAWTWSELRQQFYLHQFLPEQPDLNFLNPDVLAEMLEIVDFWLRRGAAGLRVDSAIYLIEDPDFADEPDNPDWKQGQDPYYRLLHVNTVSKRRSAEIVGEWRQYAADKFPGQSKVIITEAYDAIPKLIEYYGPTPAKRYADLPFNFELLKLRLDNLDSSSIERTVMNWIGPTRALGWPDEQGAMSPWIIWVTGNHDNSRTANRLGVHNVALLRLLSYLMPGVPVNYYGDEIPIHDANFNSIPRRTIDEGEPTRLPFRVPMAWSPEEPAGGFSESGEIWLPLNSNWKSANVESLLADNSTDNELKHFLKLQGLRKTLMRSFVFNDLVFFNREPESPATSRLLAIGRTHERLDNLLLLANLDTDNELTVRLRPRQSLIRNRTTEPPRRAQVLLLNRLEPERAPQLGEGAVVELEGLVLARSQLVLLKYQESPLWFGSSSAAADHMG